MFCVYCGAKLDDDALFCTSCGKKVLEDGQTVNFEDVDKIQPDSVNIIPTNENTNQPLSDNDVISFTKDDKTLTETHLNNTTDDIVAPAPLQEPTIKKEKKKRSEEDKAKRRRLSRYIVALVFSLVPIYSLGYTIPCFIIGLKTRKKSKAIFIISLIAFILSLLTIVSFFVAFILSLSDPTNTPDIGPYYNWPSEI
ncbi:MAG: zinc ribbon domain-containing protein [Clostridia bacterium]|nr:zinc ribbon domain-containing protein [Clostridia bacterium]